MSDVENKKYHFLYIPGNNAPRSAIAIDPQSGKFTMINYHRVVEEIETLDLTAPTINGSVRVKSGDQTALSRGSYDLNMVVPLTSPALMHAPQFRLTSRETQAYKGIICTRHADEIISFLSENYPGYECPEFRRPGNEMDMRREPWRYFGMPKIS